MNIKHKIGIFFYFKSFIIVLIYDHVAFYFQNQTGIKIYRERHYLTSFYLWYNLNDTPLTNGKLFKPLKFGTNTVTLQR